MSDQLFSDTGEAAHELRMRELGEAQYDRLSRRARERGELTVLPSGRALLRGAIRPVELQVKDWIGRAEEGPGVGHHYLPLLKKVDPGILAMLATTVVVDGLHRPRTAGSVCGGIGRAVEDEVRFREVRRDEPELWADIKRATKRSTPTHRRRVAVHRAGKAGVLGTRWDSASRLAVGAILMECVRLGTGLFEVKTEIIGPKRQVTTVTPTDGAVAWLAGADEHAARIMPLYMPTIDVPVPWPGVDGGGYHTDVVLRRPIARFRGPRHEEAVREKGVPLGVLGAVNALQEVPWRVNEDLLETLLEAERRGAGYLPDITEEDVPPKPPNIEEDEPARKAWRRTARAARDRNVARRSRRIAFHRTLRVAEELRGRPIYYPHRLDFRGRAYPTPHWLSPQGDDLAKSLLIFDRGAEMTPDGWDALYAYGASLWGAKGNRESLTHDGRALVLAGDNEFDRVANDPNEHTWWTNAKSPFQFLAWCLEVARLRADPSTPTRLPVRVDASNNGLQLFALLTGDRELAQATNAVAGPNQPSDLYTLIGQDVGTKAELDRTNGVPEAEAWGLALEDDLVRPALLIPREVVKRPVMTLPYGVTLWSAQGYVRDWHDAKWPNSSPLAGVDGVTPGRACRYLAKTIMESVEGRCRGAVLAMDWIRDVARACGEQGVPLRWEGPTGWVVVQEYRKSKVRRVRALLGGAVHKLRVRQSGGQVDTARQGQGAAPNFVHSIDAAVMHLVAEQAHIDGIPITTVHDSFGVPAPFVPRLQHYLREAVAACTVDINPLSRLQAEASEYSHLQLPDPPRLGTISREEVLSAEYLFQ